jgi:hypothetical protein
LQKTQATAELEQTMADYPHFVSATQRDGMGLFSPNAHWRMFGRFKNQIVFYLLRFRWQSHGVRGPHLPRRVAQAKWVVSAIGCLCSATSHVLCGLSGRVSMDAHFAEQRRNQAEAGVHFFWLLILWASKEK